MLPRGWLGFPASSAFPGGDIDHTASYADAFSAPDTREAFALGERTSKTLGSFARAHGDWLVANRPCRPAGSMKRAELSGSPALISAYGCTAGVYGRTYVVKWITVRRGLGLVFTQFSPEGHRTSDRAVLAGLLRGLFWRR